MDMADLQSSSMPVCIDTNMSSDYALHAIHAYAVQHLLAHMGLGNPGIVIAGK